MLPGNEVALLDGALLRKTTQAFQKQLLPFPAAQAADCISVSCQLLFSLPKTLELCGTGIPACPNLSAAPKRTDKNACLHATALRGTAAVVRNRRDVTNHYDVTSRCRRRFSRCYCRVQCCILLLLFCHDSLHSSKYLKTLTAGKAGASSRTPKNH